jgi:phospholipid/cholesterol/gamma-HCH transport system substrate-binding protein
MNNTSKNIAIGIVVCCALALIVWKLLFLHPSVGDGGQHVHVRFSNVEKIAKGTRVTYAGKPVGTVVGIKMLPESRTAASPGAPIYAYELTLAIDSSIPVYNSDDVSIKTTGLMGEKAIEITPRTSITRMAKRITGQDILYAEAPGSMDETFSGITSALHKMEKTLDEVMGLQDDIENTLKAIDNSATEFAKLLKRANDLDIMNSAQTALTKIDATVNEFQEQKIAQHLGSTAKNLDALTAQISANGSFAKLMNDDQLYAQTVAMINKLNLLVSDVTSYGFLFHLDKRWQRDKRRLAEEETTAKK